LENVRKFIRFLRESWDELKKVTWLTRQQMLASTWLVILLVLFFAVLVFLFDKLLLFLFKIFI